MCNSLVLAVLMCEEHCHLLNLAVKIIDTAPGSSVQAADFHLGLDIFLSSSTKVSNVY